MTRSRQWSGVGVDDLQARAASTCDVGRVRPMRVRVGSGRTDSDPGRADRRRSRRQSERPCALVHGCTGPRPQLHHAIHHLNGSSFDHASRERVVPRYRHLHGKPHVFEGKRNDLVSSHALHPETCGAIGQRHSDVQRRSTARIDQTQRGRRAADPSAVDAEARPFMAHSKPVDEIRARSGERRTEGYEESDVSGPDG